MMIEIAIADIAKYDMVQVLQRAEQGEQVILSHNGKQFSVMPNDAADEEAKKLAILDDIFANIQVKLPKNYQFNREEIYDRP